MQNTTLYIERLKQLLTMEYEAEREEFRVQSEKMSIERKIRRGICWWPVSVGRSYYNSLNQLVVEIHENGNRADTEDEELDVRSSSSEFEYGKPVQFFQPAKEKGGKVRYLSFTSVISYVDGGRMVVTVPSAANVA